MFKVRKGKENLKSTTNDIHEVWILTGVESGPCYHFSLRESIIPLYASNFAWNLILHFILEEKKLTFSTDKEFSVYGGIITGLRTMLLTGFIPLIFQ